jgi:hypothetical protein
MAPERQRQLEGIGRKRARLQLFPQWLSMACFPTAAQHTSVVLEVLSIHVALHTRSS